MIADAPLMPALSPEMQAVIRSAYGVLMMLTLVAALPHARRYFMSERWGGYTESSAVTDAVQNPTAIVITLGVWIASAVALAVGALVMVAAACNLACCYYFFNRLRWTSASRGMGAPGFIALWLAAAIFLIELTARHAPAVHGLALLTVQIDFGAIMLTAGLYKLAAGYRHQHGMELGMVNPEWGYWPSFWQSWRPGHPLFRFLDEMAWGTEVVCGILMLIPATRALGGAGILLSFIFIATQIRLGFLSEMVIVACLLFFPANGLVDQWVVSVWRSLDLAVALPGRSLPDAVQSLLVVGLWGYLALLPFVRVGMFYNQLRHRSLPAALQRTLDAYANFFGLILWRVFTADVVNFFVRVWEQLGSGERRLISVFHRTGISRFSQVAECIALTTVFTTLKYYPSNRALFEQRLLRYARTIPREPSSSLVFEWVGIQPGVSNFAYLPVAEFVVDPLATSVAEHVLSTTASVRGVPAPSPVHEGARPGSYAPLGR